MNDKHSTQTTEKAVEEGDTVGDTVHFRDTLLLAHSCVYVLLQF